VLGELLISRFQPSEIDDASDCCLRRGSGERLGHVALGVAEAPARGDRMQQVVRDIHV